MGRSVRRKTGENESWPASSVVPGRIVDRMVLKEAKERAKELRKEIEYHNKKYYVEDDPEIDRKSTRLNSSHSRASRMPSSA